MKVLILLLCCLLSGCAIQPPAETVAEVTVAVPATTETVPTVPPETTMPAAVPLPTEAADPIREIISSLSLRERVGQLFLARCDSSVALEDLETYHLGGFVLFGQDFQGQTPDSLRQKLAAYQAAGRLPLLIAVDEEGGTVTRVSSNPAFRASKFPSPRNAYAQSGMEGAVSLELEKSRFLVDLGINVNLGPVCDITTDPSAFMYSRSLGQDVLVTSKFITRTVDVMSQAGIGSCLKHFPGYGNNTDTHVGMATDSRSLTELEFADLLPFTAGIAAGCDAILVSHTIIEALDPQSPASLSPAVHSYLRNEMRFGGVIVTDDLAMQAITHRYGAGEAAVQAVLAGNDLLCASDYRTQFDAVYAAVLDGRIDIDTLNSAVRNVLEWKTELGLI